MGTWIPIESNPEVWNEYAAKLGVSREWVFVDVFGLDPELLAMVPTPVKAVLMLFPITSKYEQYREAQDTALSMDYPPSLFFVRQTIANACGTIALIHSVVNNEIDISNGVLEVLYEEMKGCTSDLRAKVLENSKELFNLQHDSSVRGQTSVSSQFLDVSYRYRIHRMMWIYILYAS